ncbi:MAG: hypothetical protein KKD38_04395 [Candidatus Delongbacteria bacterium]|nr:hypothetical protein [Candidatus Delongbacteria bacterium]MCG2760271.1 hypothetical protein [Candidatus Delongbacteria bacterium]
MKNRAYSTILAVTVIILAVTSCTKAVNDGFVEDPIMKRLSEVEPVVCAVVDDPILTFSVYSEGRYPATAHRGLRINAEAEAAHILRSFVVDQIILASNAEGANGIIDEAFVREITSGIKAEGIVSGLIMTKRKDLFLKKSDGSRYAYCQGDFSFTDASSVEKIVKDMMKDAEENVIKSQKYDENIKKMIKKAKTNIESFKAKEIFN